MSDRIFNVLCLFAVPILILISFGLGLVLFLLPNYPPLYCIVILVPMFLAFLIGTSVGYKGRQVDEELDR